MSAVKQSEPNATAMKPILTIYTSAIALIDTHKSQRRYHSPTTAMSCYSFPATAMSCCC